MLQSFGMLAALLLGGGAGAEVANQSAKLSGLWMVTEITAAGRKGAIGGAFQFLDGKIIVTNGNRSRDIWKYKLNPSSTRKAIDLAPTKGPAAGRTLKGIYKFDNDVLRLCYISPTFSKSKRPSTFEAAGHLVHVTLKRAPAPDCNVPWRRGKDINGAWRLIAHGDKKRPPLIWEFRDGVLYVMSTSGRTISISQFRIDTSQTPKQINLYLSDSGGRETRQGIFVVDQRKLYLDLRVEGDRPVKLEKCRALMFERIPTTR